MQIQIGTKLGLGEPLISTFTDDFLFREGYERRQRHYQPVIRCWCGSANLTAADHAQPQFQDYQVCNSCGCLLLKLVLREDYLSELYGPRFFREVQAAIGLPPFSQRYESDVNDRIPIWIQTLRQFVPAGRILEVGCGHGRFLKELSLLGYEVVGLELDSEIAQWAREKTGVDIRGQRLETVSDEPFDGMFANDVLEHVYDRRSLSEMPFA